VVKKQSKELIYKDIIANVIREKSLSLLLGTTIVIIGIIFLIFFLQKNSPSTITTKNVSKKITITPPILTNINRYLVSEGDYLWKIAEENYGSGFNAYDIAKANNINDPNFIYKGQTLIIPKVTPKIPTRGEIIEAKTERVLKQDTNYTIQTGDYLWKIASEFYGDGYGWVRIAKANNLTDPNIIYSGNTLFIPR